MSLSFDNTEIAFRYKNDKQLQQANFLFSSMSFSALTKAGIAATGFALKLHLPVEGIIKRTIFEQFCGGENLEEVAKTADLLAPYHVGVALDYGVEGKSEESDFDNAVPEFVNAIRYAATKKNIPFVPIKVTGFARFALLEKLQNGSDLSESEKMEWARVTDRIDTICHAAYQHKIMILIDAEESWIQKPVDDLANQMMQHYNKERATVFNTFQLYCHDRLEFLKKSYTEAQSQKYILGAKLVRGAYMEKERKRAAELGYKDPIQPDKATCDKDYNAAVLFCLSHHDIITTFIGTHNEDSCLIAANIMKEQRIPNDSDKVYFAQLYGMSDNITFNFANEHYNVSKYLPYGPVRDVIPYLMRRAQENTSVKGQTGRELALIKKELKRRKSLKLKR